MSGLGRLAQRESACFTRKRSLVRNQRRPPAHRSNSATGIASAAWPVGEQNGWPRQRLTVRAGEPSP